MTSKIKQDVISNNSLNVIVAREY